jgi:hypothetical protein
LIGFEYIGTGGQAALGVVSAGNPNGTPFTGGNPFNVTSPSNQIKALGTDAPRAFPAAQIMQSLSVTINNATVTTPVYDYIDALLRYNAFRDLDETQFSNTLDQQDQYQSYGDWLNYGSSRNVLGNYGEQAFYTNRGGFAGLSVYQNPLGDGVHPATAIFYLDVMEPLFISPLDFGMANERGLVGVQVFQVNVNVGDTTRVWSHDAVNGQTITNFTSIIGSATNAFPSLQFNYITPKLTQPIPEVNIYPYYSIDEFVKAYVGNTMSVAPFSAPVTVTSDSRNLLTIPKRMYIYVRQTNSDRTYNDTDTYALITNLSIDFINKNSLINGATTEQLYQISVKNGCKLSWSQWTKYVGSVICLDMAQDVSMVEDQAVGLITNNLQIRVTASFVNIGGKPMNFSLYVVPTYPGLFNMNEQQAVPQVGIITKEDIMSAPNVHIDYYDAHNFYGGDFLGKAKSIGRSIVKGATSKTGKAAARLADQYLPEVVGTFAPRLKGATKGATELYKKLVGAGYNHSDAQQMVMDQFGGDFGDSYLGGRRMTKKGMGASKRKIMQRAIGY